MRANHEQGFLLLTVLGMALVMLVLASGMALMAQSSLKMGSNAAARVRAQQAADAAGTTALLFLKNTQNVAELQSAVQQLSVPLQGGQTAQASIQWIDRQNQSVVLQITAKGSAENHATAEKKLLVQLKDGAQPLKLEVLSRP